MTLQYNPTVLRRTRNAKWTLHMPPGGIFPLPQYASAGMEDLDIELLLDSREHAERNYVKYQLAFLESLLLPQLGELDEVIGQFRSAPIALFTFGANRSWYAVVKTMNITEEMFDQALVPIRARVRMNMTAVFVGVEQQEQTLLDLQSDALKAGVLAQDSSSSNTGV